MSENTATANVSLSSEGALAWITIDNRPKHNAMSRHMWQALDEAVSSLPAHARCLILRGAGAKAFVSGADISEFAGRRRTHQDVAAFDDAAEAAMQRLYQSEIPTIAMISGYCFGGGVALALCCDVRIASQDAVVSIPPAKLGVGYGWKGLKKLLDAVSVPVATDLMMSGRRIAAPEALRVGLVNAVHAAERLEAETIAYANQIAQNAPLTVRSVKQIIKELARLEGPDLALCDRLVARCFDSEDYLEGTRAFMEKRAPRFQGK